MSSYTRREVLRNGWKVGGAFLGLAAGWTVWESLRPLADTGKKAKIKLGKVGQFAVGTATYVPEGRLYVVNAPAAKGGAGTIFALSQKCPHLGCRVPFCDSSGRFECACHGSVYDLAGEWIKGPAPRGMDQFQLSQENGELIVDTGKVIPGPDHGTDTYLQPPKGPSCQKKG